MNDLQGIVILGNHGGGKSSYLRHLAWYLTHNQSKIIVLICLEAWQKSNNDLTGYLADYYRQSRQFFLDEMVNNNIILLLDGYDKIDFCYQQYLVKDLKKINCYCVVTCDVANYTHYKNDISHLRLYYLQGMKQQHKHLYIDNYPKKYYAHTHQEIKGFLDLLPHIDQITTNPSMLSIICWVFSRKHKEISTVRTITEIYKVITDSFLSQIQINKTICFEKITAINLLENLALCLFIKDKNRKCIYHKHEIITLLQYLLQQKGYNVNLQTCDKYLSMLVDVGLLQFSKSKYYYFVHSTLQEYLSSCSLVRHIQNGNINIKIMFPERQVIQINLEQIIHILTWNRIIIFSFGALRKPDIDILLCLIEKNTRYQTVQALMLTLHCCSELIVQPKYGNIYRKIHNAAFSNYANYVDINRNFILDYVIFIEKEIIKSFFINFSRKNRRYVFWRKYQYIYLYKRARKFFYLGKNYAALTLFCRIIHGCKDTGDFIGIAKSYNGIGEVYFSEGKNSKAKSYTYIEQTMIKKFLFNLDIAQ